MMKIIIIYMIIIILRGFNPVHQQEELGRDAGTFDQNKQIYLSTLPRTGFYAKVYSYLSLS